MSVKRSGRVRLHKARENNNGTFSIGKTWVLDDLTAIESFTGSTPITYAEQQRKEWAGDTGVLVTIQKPYFWQTATAKEKDFFVGSLVKIYRKYTKGREPTLTGFLDRELAEFSSASSQRAASGQPPASNPPSPAPTNAPSFDSSATSNNASQPLRSPRPSHETNGSATRDLRPPSSGSTSTRESEPQDRPPLRNLGATDASQGLRPRDPAARVRDLRSGSNSSAKQEGTRPVTPKTDAQSRPSGPNSSLESLPNSRFDARTSPGPNGDRPRANGTYSPFPRKEAGPLPPPEQPVPPGPKSPGRRQGSRDQQVARPPSPREEAPPERKRPPLVATSSAQDESGKSTPGSFATPKEVGSPEPANEGAAVSNEKGLEQLPKRSAGDFFMNASRRMKELEAKRPVATEALSETPTDIKDISQALSALSSPSEAPDSPDEVHRPGLGPMIRKKKSSKEVAETFRKAAMAHNAFKPRAGGAGERLRDELTKPLNTPDGIHGVFVAPSKEAMKSPAPPASAASQEVTSPPPLDISKNPVVSPGLPSVEVKRASDVPEVRPLSIPKAEERDKSPGPSKEAEPKKRPSDYSAKYAKALGIDPLLLEGRTLEIDSVLTDFGWADSDKMKKSFEDLQADIRRDLAKIETGSWLGNFEHGDERIYTVDRLLDRAIAECDELDGLLTLYNVELGVCNSLTVLRSLLTLCRRWPMMSPISKRSRKDSKFKQLIKGSSKRNLTASYRPYRFRLLSLAYCVRLN